MGLLIGIIRLRQLRLMQSNCEWKLQLITQATDYEADTMIAKKLQQRQYKLKLLEEKLDMQKEALEQQLKEINAEMESCRGMIDKHISSSFSYKVA